ncbi:hypothetical protein GCM10022409_02360 [Hymenobacter glaciei]|uniref:Uncharacterized protein n=1 Tax=Hymenobacter glaciei TaxID=877209 RepID=A0ABP7T7G2_9BACT
MDFSEGLLRKLIQGEIVGNFSPFSTGKGRKVEAYIAALVDQLKKMEGSLVDVDFTSYGNGFASYGEVKISKLDKSDTVFVNTGRLGQGVREDHTDGLVLYISTLAPYWFYGGSSWLASGQNGQWKSGPAGFLRPSSMVKLDQGLWHGEVERIEAIMQSFRYTLLGPELLEQPAPNGLTIPTILADSPYQVFDCFFYWED